MRGASLGKRLIAELLDDSKGFFESAKAYELLQEFFGGLALGSLRPLLTSNDQYIRRTALWITSELGPRGCDLIGEVLQLQDDPDRYIQYHVLEIIAVCAHGEQSGAFAHVARSLESQDDVLRILAMRLISNAEPAQLKSAADSFDFSRRPEQLHAKGLLDLATSESLD